MYIDNNLQEILDNKGMDQIDLVKRLAEIGVNITNSNINRICKKRQRTSILLGYQIAKVLGKSFDEIFVFVEESIFN